MGSEIPSAFQTQIMHAKAGHVTEQMTAVAQSEGLAPETVRAEVAAGRMIIPTNRRHTGAKPIGIGITARCKINANVGTSASHCEPHLEVEKVRLAISLGADTVMDLSTGGDLEAIRAAVIAAANVPVGTVPIYEAATRVEHVSELEADDFFAVVERHAQAGVDYMTIHAALLADHMRFIRQRTAGIVSRGGSLIACWMALRKQENPFYAHFDRLLDLCREYDVSISLGDGLRPGCLADAGDEAQMAELDVMGELVQRCRQAGVQVMAEGPGHVPLDQVEWQVRKAAEVTGDAPFYVLGPVVTDIAPGYDHITSAIGGAMAAWAGASMLCYVTPSEHLGLPNLDDVRHGVVAARIAAHAGDVARGRSNARQVDDVMSRARRRFDWQTQFQLCLDPQTARAVHRQRGSSEDEDGCTMCGSNLCALRLNDEILAAATGNRS
jgi:phosphomethylpyrimidine synthase